MSALAEKTSQVDETEERLRQRLVGRYKHLVRSKKALEPTYNSSNRIGGRVPSYGGGLTTTPNRSPATSTTSSPEQQGGSSSFAKLAAREKLYRRVNGEVRLSVERYVNNPNSSTKKKGHERKSLDEAQCRSCFTLRECKDHEQRNLVRMFVANGGFAGLAVNGPFEKTQVLGKQAALAECVKKLQHNEEHEHAYRARLKAQRSKAAADRARLIQQKRNAAAAAATTTVNKDQNENMMKTHSLLEQRERDEARAREKHRLLARKLEEEGRTARLAREKEERERKARMSESPRQALRRLYQPIFQALWDMEFENLGNTNPFRIVIDKDNCHAMGVPDYCDVIKKPMNLMYIQTKVNDQSYSTLQEFFADVELVISNALQYNSDPKNPYHVAAKELRKHYKKLAKRRLQEAQARSS